MSRLRWEHLAFIVVAVLAGALDLGWIPSGHWHTAAEHLVALAGLAGIYSGQPLRSRRTEDQLPLPDPRPGAAGGPLLALVCLGALFAGGCAAHSTNTLCMGAGLGALAMMLGIPGGRLNGSPFSPRWGYVTLGLGMLSIVLAVGGCASGGLPPPRAPADPAACAAATIAAAAKIPSLVTSEIEACRPPVDGVKCAETTAANTAAIGELVLAEKTACSPAPTELSPKMMELASRPLNTATAQLATHDALLIVRKAARQQWRMVHDALVRQVRHEDELHGAAKGGLSLRERPIDDLRLGLVPSVNALSLRGQ